MWNFCSLPTRQAMNIRISYIFLDKTQCAWSHHHVLCHSKELINLFTLLQHYFPSPLPTSVTFIYSPSFSFSTSIAETARSRSSSCLLWFLLCCTLAEKASSTPPSSSSEGARMRTKPWSSQVVSFSVCCSWTWYPLSSKWLINVWILLVLWFHRPQFW